MYIVMLARNAVIRPRSRPVASATMFTCCSTMAAPPAASPITSAITRKWRRARQHPQRLGAADTALLLEQPTGR